MTSEKTSRERDQPVLCPLADMGVIEVAGAEAEAFLNAQLSCNVDSGKPLRATLAAWHDARGRVLALVWAFWTRDRWLLLAKGADVDALIRRLRMFVLRADVQLRNATSEWRAAAVLGGIEAWLASRSVSLGTRPGDMVNTNGVFMIRVGPGLAWLVSAGQTPGDFERDFPANHGESGAPEEIRLGLVDLVPEITGRYTAHMLNLDRLGAVAFDKGCFPGQEVIARTQNLGSVKRRVLRFSGTMQQAPAVGTALLDSNGRSVGEVVRAATDSGTTVELLAVVRVAAASGALTCATEDRVQLTRASLPGD